MSSRLKNAQEDSDGIAQANQSIPLAQSQSDQDIDCGSNNIQTVPQEQQNNAQGTSEVSSSHDQPVSTTSGGVSSSVNYSDSDEADDCPVFEYSAESMLIAKDSKESPDSTPNNVDQTNVEENMENDEDLVQLDDDEHFGNETGISEEHLNQTQTEAEQSIESPVASPETTTNTGTESPETAPLTNECESSEATASKSKETDDVSDSEDQMAGSSEAQPKSDSDVQKRSKDKNENSNIGIEGMDTEMISEDEHELHDEQVSKENKADKENNNQKSDRDDSFKKVSKSNKDRNYRDKKEKNVSKGRSRRSRSKSSISRSRSRSRSRLRSRTRSRSRSRNRNRRGDRRPRRKDRDKRQEIQRYDVRTLIADRQPRSVKDKYGRDTSRPPRSITPPRRGRSLSRSISPGLCQSTQNLFQ